MSGPFALSTSTHASQPPMSSSPPERITSLDLLRGLSALVVVAGHVRQAMLPDFPQLQDPGWLTQAFYLLSGMGHQAVIVFFVLSGYFVGGAVVAQGSAFRPLDYAVARLTRLWVVVLPALLLTWVADQVVMNHLPHVLDQAHVVSWHCLPESGVLDHGWATLLGNVLFVQTVFVPYFGSNGPLWSLAYEAWYYALFPLWWVGVHGRGSWAMRLGLLTLAVLTMAFMHSEMLMLWPAWLFGVWARGTTWVPSFLPARLTGGVMLAIVLALLVATRLSLIPAWFAVWPDLLLAAAVAVWCWHVRAARPARWPAWLRRAAFEASDMSFSLYVMHMPLVLLLVGALIRDGKLDADASGWGAYAAVMLTIVVLARLFWWFFERHAPTVRRWVVGLTPRSRGVSRDHRLTRLP